MILKPHHLSPITYHLSATSYELSAILRFLHFFHYLRRFLIALKGTFTVKTGYFVNVRGTTLLGHVVAFARFARFAVFFDSAKMQFECKWLFC